MRFARVSGGQLPAYAPPLRIPPGLSFVACDAQRLEVAKVGVASAEGIGPDGVNLDGGVSA